MIKNFFKRIFELSLGIFTTIILAVNTIIFFIPIFIIGFLKLLPIPSWKRKATQCLNYLSAIWISINTTFIDYSRNIQWEIDAIPELSQKNWYFVICNHQTWMDIPVLHKVFNRKIPMLKPFIKSGLKWVPFLGFAWWALDCPFVKRYSPSFLKKNPHKKNRDLKHAALACERFKKLPVSVLSFIEGTRFSPEKRTHQSSPYQYLLKPRAGGVAYVVNTMGETLNKILDVTILYPKNHRTLWDYLCGRVTKIKIAIREISVPEKFINMAYNDNPDVRHDFYQWLNETWLEKDKLIQQTLALNPER
jgi:1-acyl-sn-glycerol-3-phosphate acyltransferase